MHPIYFAHGYRQREAPFAAYFGTLLRQMELLPSLDPPSADVNAAKLERHLGYTVGLVAILTDRPEGPSPHVLFEIAMGLRAGKPLLVFVEDSLPGDLVPRRALQRRFSARSYLRETREHIHALEILSTYIGERTIPRYQPSTEQRSCLLVGLNRLGQEYADAVTRLLRERGYGLLSVPDSSSVVLSGYSHFALRELQLAICLVDDQSPPSTYVTGALQATLTPMIQLTTDENAPLLADVPREYQRRFVPRLHTETGLETIERQLELFEEDFVELDQDGKAERYAHLLSLAASPRGIYTENTRVQIMQEITMGDKYVAGQVGAQGPGAHAEHITFQQVWLQNASSIPLSQLADELSRLRSHMRKKATDPDHDLALGAVAAAEKCATNKDGVGALQSLAKAGKWTLECARDIGVEIAAAAIAKTIGL